jgi:hypothetical protein
MTGTAAFAAPVEHRRYPLATLLALFVFATLLFTPAFVAFLELRQSSDLTDHLIYASQLDSPADLKSPHFLFELLVKAGYTVGLGYAAAAVWLLGACYGGMAVLIGHEMHRRGVTLHPLRVCVLVMAVLLAAHIFLFTTQSHLYSGYFVPTAYHNPTQQLNKLFALWIYFVYCREFLGARPASLWSASLLAVLCVSSAVAKPSFLIAFLPAAALVAAHDLVRRRWRQALLCLAGIGIPSALILLWQTTLGDDGGRPVEFAFRPFVVFDAGETLYKLPLSLAFAMVVAVGAWWTRTADATLRFIWMLTGLALFVTLCFVESGHRVDHGNFAWTGQTAVFLVYVESLLFMLTRAQQTWARAAWVVFGVHVISGLFWYGIIFRGDWEFWL